MLGRQLHRKLVKVFLSNERECMINIAANLSWDPQSHRHCSFQRLMSQDLCSGCSPGQSGCRFTVCFTVAGRRSRPWENPPQRRLTACISPQLVFLFAVPASPECTHSVASCTWLAGTEYELKSVTFSRRRTSAGRDSAIVGIVRSCITRPSWIDHFPVDLERYCD